MTNYPFRRIHCRSIRFFTTIGSATRRFIVYNTSSKSVRISRIQLEGKSGNSSQFRLNVDGSANKENTFSDVEIAPKDSMYVFVEVTIDPNKENSPVLVEDSVLFLTNGNRQRVKLMAFGQDVNLLKDVTFDEDTELRSPKPYLVYGDVTVKSGTTLTLPAGCKIYFHNNANLMVYGNLMALGTYENPVLLRGDRLDKVNFSNPVPYNYISGQWGGVYLLASNAKHTMNHVIMNSGYVGIYLSNDNRNELPELTITDSKIHNFLYYNLVVINGNVTVANSEISNAGSYCVYLNGGTHRFIQSTIANFFDGSIQPQSRDGQPALLIMNLNKVAPMKTVFENCVIAGSSTNEFSLLTRYPETYDASFVDCYVGRKDTLALKQFTETLWYSAKDTLFTHPKYEYKTGGYYNFTPDSVSRLRGRADASIASHYPLDLNGNSRLADGKPDIGAYQWQPTKK